MSAAVMRREMMETVQAMRDELALVERLDDAAEDAVVRLRLRLTWLQMAFRGLREAEVAELAAMRRGLLRVGDKSLLEEVGV